MPRSKGPTAEQAYLDAYKRGIQKAAPGVPFVVIGRVGSVLGPAVRAHAVGDDGKSLSGDAILSWIEDNACSFRKSTDGRAQFYGGWSPYFFARWLNERGSKPQENPVHRLQGPTGKRLS